MANLILREGSRGNLVAILQKGLNAQGKLPTPIPDNGQFGPETKEAVRFFQKRVGLKVDGTVGAETADALAKLIGASAAPFAKAFSPAEQEDKKGADKPKEKVYTLPIDGKNYIFTQKQFDDFNKQLFSELKRTAVLAVEQRAVAARSIWDSFNEINRDQYVVSWFVSSLGGPKLPDEILIKKAEKAYDRFRSAVEAGDRRNIAKELKDVSDPVNDAYNTMMSYRKDVIGRGETWVKGLEFTRDTSFKIVTMIAEAELGEGPGSNAIAEGGSELIKSAAGQLGEYLAGTSEGGAAAARKIALDGLVGAFNGAAGGFMKVKGDQLIKGVAESLAKKMAGQWIRRLGTATVQKFLAKRLEGAMTGAFEAAVKGAGKLVKGETTKEQFFEEVAKGLGWGGLLSGLDPWISSKFNEAVYKNMNSALRTKLFGKLKPKEAIDLLGEAIDAKGSDGVKAAMQKAFDMASGSENPEDIGKSAADIFAGSNLGNLEAEIAKRVKAAT